MSWRESTAMITPYMKFNQNLRGRVLFQDFFGRSVVERPYCKEPVSHWVQERNRIGASSRNCRTDGNGTGLERWTETRTRYGCGTGISSWDPREIWRQFGRENSAYNWISDNYRCYMCYLKVHLSAHASWPVYYSTHPDFESSRGGNVRKFACLFFTLITIKCQST